MMRSFMTLGAVFLSICLIQFLGDHGIKPSIEATISTGSENALTWTPSATGRYFLYLCYRAGSVPRGVRETFLNWKNPPRTNWEAVLLVRTNGGVCLSKKSLDLEPAIESGERLYFLVGQCEFKQAAHVEVILTPQGLAPFGGTVPCLSLRPVERDDKSYYRRRVFWRAADYLCLPVGVALLFGCIRSRKRSARGMDSAD